MLSKNSLSTAGFTVQLLSPDGMGWDLESRALIESANTSLSNATFAFNVGGSYKTDPTITLTINTITGGTDKTITLANAESLRSVAVRRNWIAGDVLEIDTLKGTVLVNGGAQDFTGQLLSFEPGVAGLTYLDDFTARDVTITASYTRRWL
jgi:hypothetical protein